MSSLFERVARALFGPAEGKPSEADQQLIDDAIEGFVEIVEPRVRLRSGYRDKLAPDMRRTIAHLREFGRELPPEPIALSRDAWSQDPRVRAFFGAAADIPVVVGRSRELRRFFDGHPGASEACALLGMQRQDKTVLAARMEGGQLRQDVAQTTVSFSGHRLLAPAEDAAHVRLEIGHRIMQRLAQLVLARIVGVEEQAKALDEHKAYLGMKLRMLQRARDGMQSLVSEEGAGTEQQIHDVERALKETTEGYREAKHSLTTLDGYIAHMSAVLAHPEEHAALTQERLRLNRMGVKVEPGSEEADDIDLAELSIGEGQRATVALVRIPRAELPPKEDMLAQAQKLL
jgi:hypothetical protein